MELLDSVVELLPDILEYISIQERLKFFQLSKKVRRLCNFQGKHYREDFSHFFLLSTAIHAQNWENVWFSSSSPLSSADRHEIFLLSSPFRQTFLFRIRLFAGTGEPGFSGDGGPALNAQLQSPSYIFFNASDSSCLFSEQNQGHIRSISSSEIITTAFPLLSNQHSTNLCPTGLIQSFDGKIKFCDPNSSGVFSVDSTGKLERIAGVGYDRSNGTHWYQTGMAKEIALRAPHQLFEDSDGNLVLSELMHLIRIITPDGRSFPLLKFLPSDIGDIKSLKSFALDSEKHIIYFLVRIGYYGVFLHQSTYQVHPLPDSLSFEEEEGEESQECYQEFSEFPDEKINVNKIEDYSLSELATWGEGLAVIFERKDPKVKDFQVFGLIGTKLERMAGGGTKPITKEGIPAKEAKLECIGRMSGNSDGSKVVLASPASHRLYILEASF